MELEEQSSGPLSENPRDEVTEASCSELANVTEPTSKVSDETDNGDMDDEAIFPTKLKKKKHFPVHDSDDEQEETKPKSYSEDEIENQLDQLSEEDLCKLT